MKSLFAIPLLWASATLGIGQALDVDEALRLAANNRSSVQAAQKLVEQARFQAHAQRAYPPTVLGVGASSNQAIGGTDDDLYISQAIDIFGRTSASRRLGQAGIEEAKAKLQATLLELQGDVLTAYFEAATAAELSRAADDLLGVAEALRNATTRRFEEGKVPEVQVTRSTIELDRAKQAAAMRKAHLQAALRRLAGALGVVDAPTEVNLIAGLQKPPILNLAARPDLQLLRAEMLTADAEAGLVSASRRPELELRAMRSPWGDSDGVYGGRIQLTWSLFDHGKARSESLAAKKKAEAAEKSYEDAERKAKSELGAVEIEIASAAELVSSYTEIVDLARNLVSRSQLGYSEGVGTLIDVLEATRSLREVEQERAEARLQLNKSWIAYYRTTGTILEALK